MSVRGTEAITIGATATVTEIMTGEAGRIVRNAGRSAGRNATRSAKSAGKTVEKNASRNESSVGRNASRSAGRMRAEAKSPGSTIQLARWYVDSTSAGVKGWMPTGY